MEFEGIPDRRTRLALTLGQLIKVAGVITDEECEICLLHTTRVLEAVIGRREFPFMVLLRVAEKVEKEDKKSSARDEDTDPPRGSPRKLGKRWDPMLEDTHVHRVVNLEMGGIMLVETSTDATLNQKAQELLVFPDDVDNIKTRWWPHMAEYFKAHDLPDAYKSTAFGQWCLSHGFDGSRK